MKRIAIVLLPASLLFVVWGCHIGVHGSGVRKTEKRDLPSFTAIETTGAFEVQVTCQKPASFEIEGDDNLLPLIQTEVRNGVLRVSSTKRYSTRNTISLRITVPDLASVSSTGAGKIRVSDLKNENFEIHSTGAATVIVDGQSTFVRISSTGAGRIDTHDLRASRVEVSVTGAASVDVYASEQLDVTVSGAGRVIYSGDAKVNKHVSGAGQVTKKQETGV
ncbi:MAG TPA: head GIN domain-containing protein [Pyrinomonadaceae bacterium]|nr:head GIN domain-containing protein [Pyrinomonadaceae bacterium]